MIDPLVRFEAGTAGTCDLSIPSGEGFDVLEFLQYNPAWNVVPRIALSSSDDDPDVRTSYLLGASIYHVKPLEPTAFETLLRHIVAYWASGQVAPGLMKLAESLSLRI